MTRHRLAGAAWRVLALAVLLAWVAGCGGTIAPPPDDGVHATLLPTGGTHTFADGQVVLTVPPGAVASATVVTVEPATTPPAVSHGTVAASTSAYNITPADLAFAADVTLSLPYDPTLIPALGDAYHARMTRAVGTRWEQVPGSTPVAGDRVTAPVRTLGTFRTLMRLDTGAADSPAYIPDPVLVEGLRGVLAKPVGDITIGELTGFAAIMDLTNRSGLVDLTGIEYCTATPDIELWNTDIVNVSRLATLTQLTHLSLGKNNIADVSALTTLTNLHTLLLAHNFVSDISPLAGMGIEEMSLSDNPVADFSPLAAMPALRTFFMAHSHLTTMPFTPYITQVTTLYLHNNDLVDLTPLTALTGLNALYLADNQITDLAPLVANAGLAAGDTIDLTNNPLDLTAGSAASLAIAALQARGVTVTTSPPA